MEVLDATTLRARMVRGQLAARDVTHPSVLRAMGRVERHLFVPPELRAEAYDDRPLCIGHGQTISQPYIVGFMTQAVDPHPGMRVLEIGLGSGYQAAVLAEIVDEVYSVEIVPELLAATTALLHGLGYSNVHTRAGDGFEGWPEEAPFHAILVTAAPLEIPAPLVAQLSAGGRLVLPIGDRSQDLVIVHKERDGSIRRETAFPVRFVPMTGTARLNG